jgi:putative methionine-R-sulfoxide reductase with GAF domain
MTGSTTGVAVPKFARDYAPLLTIAAREASSLRTREARMQRCCDLLWDAFSGAGLSWIGFYAKVPGAEEMVLEVRRDKPACSPIGLHGCCGRGWKERRPILVDDVATLGPNYIACDPRDKAELVLPMLDSDGTCWGVLDADSHDTFAFGEADRAGMSALCETLGLTAKIPAEMLRL